MVYHCTVPDTDASSQACGTVLLPLKTSTKGPAPSCEPDKEDVVDEAINFYRPNVLFRNFDVQSKGDKLLIYLSLFINLCLKRQEPCKTKADGAKVLASLVIEQFPIPGDPTFSLNAVLAAPASKDEGELFRAYLKQCREEVCKRILDKCYVADGSTQDKYWMAFAKRKFLNKTM